MSVLVIGIMYNMWELFLEIWKLYVSVVMVRNNAVPQHHQCGKRKKKYGQILFQHLNQI